LFVFSRDTLFIIGDISNLERKGLKIASQTRFYYSPEPSFSPTWHSNSSSNFRIQNKFGLCLTCRAMTQLQVSYLSKMKFEFEFLNKTRSNMSSWGLTEAECASARLRACVGTTLRRRVTVVHCLTRGLAGLALCAPDTGVSYVHAPSRHLGWGSSVSHAAQTHASDAGPPCRGRPPRPRRRTHGILAEGAFTTKCCSPARLPLI
jgi:hypothetical protein